MPSKGIEVYSYITLPNYSVKFSVPGGSITRTGHDNFTSNHLEVESKDIPGVAHFTGRFSFQVFTESGEEIANQWNDINTFDGKLEGGTMMSSKDQQSIVQGDAIITYGFYQAGHGEAGLTNLCQCYVTVVSLFTHRTWMTTVCPPASEAEQKPFSRFVLPAPHDDGMNSMATCEAVLEDRDEALVETLGKHIPAIHWLTEHMTHSMISRILPNVIYGLAITQKDPIPVLLDIGARYFEFRPAHLLPEFEGKAKHVPNRPYFQHACIPGLAFEEFLQQIVQFLDENTGEHVVVHVRWDNIVSQCKKPTPEELDEAFNIATSVSKTGLQWGDAQCFKEKIADLRASGKRLIRVVEADKYDSWTAKSYATLHPDSIITQFESMTAEGQLGSDITLLQCQATSQSIKEVLVYSILTANADTSCLTSTKADLDRHTLPWIRDNALARLTRERLLVVMNDFLDGATTDIVIGLNKRRFALP